MKNKIEINVENYKAISKVNLSLHSNTINKLIAIIGDNNNGKSSLLSALKKLANNPNTSKDEFTTYYHKETKEYKPSDIHPKISVKFIFDAKQKKLEIESYIEDNIFVKPSFQIDWIKNREMNIQTKIQELKNLDSYKKSKAFISYPVTFINENWFYNFISAMGSINDKTHSLIKEIKDLTNYKKMENKINFYDIKNINIFKYSILKLDLIFDKENAQPEELDKIRTIEIWEKILKIDFSQFLTKKAQEEDKINKKALIAGFEKKINKSLGKLSDNIFGNRMQQKLKMWFDAEDSTLNVYWQPLSLDRNIILNRKIEKTGDGFMHFWSIIFRIESINENEPSIILLDEPEKHLNPIQQNHLLKYFKMITSKEKQRINQILIYTTNSPFMIDLDIYQNIYELYRQKDDNGVSARKIYDTRDQETPNLLLDKNSELRFVESLHLTNRPKKVIFLEGISDFYVFNNLLKLELLENVILLIPMFGSEYKRIIAYHLPYLASYIETKNIKVVIDNDNQGKEIANWLDEETLIEKENIKTYQDFFNEKTLEKAILEPYLNRNNQKSINKKLDAIIFNKENKKVETYQKLIDFIKK